MPSSAYPGDDRYYGRGTLRPRSPSYAVGGDAGSGNLGYAAAVSRGVGGANSRSPQDTVSPQPDAPDVGAPSGAEIPAGGGSPQPWQNLGLPGGPPQFNADNSQASGVAYPTQAPGSVASPEGGPTLPNYYATTYAQSPSVNAPRVNPQDVGAPGGANTAVVAPDPRYAAQGSNDPNQFPGQTYTGDPYDFAGNYEYANGRPYNFAGLIPTPGGQNDTAISPSGNTFNLRPVNNRTSQDYDAWAAAEYGPNRFDPNAPQNRLTRQLAANPGSVTPATLPAWLASLPR